VDIGRDTTANNLTADTAEAGLFQMSWNARVASPLITARFTHYTANPEPSFAAVFAEDVRTAAGSFVNFGTGDGAEYQRLAKECPAFAVEAAALGLRHIRKHWGPINRKEAEVRPECDALFRQLQAAIDADPALFTAALVPDTAPVPARSPQPVPEPLPPRPASPPLSPTPRKDPPVTTVPVPAAPSSIMQFEDEVVQAVEAVLVNAIAARNPILGTLLKVVLDAGRKALLPGAVTPATQPTPAPAQQPLHTPAQSAPLSPLSGAPGAGVLPLPLAPVEAALMDALKNFVSAKTTVA
jgi:hypothetical protein